MKKVLSLVILVFFATMVFGQARSFDPIKEANMLKTKLNLDETQAKKVHSIMSHKLENLNSIESLKTTDLEKYIKKSESIFRGTSTSVQMILKKDQIKLFDKWQLEIRNKRTEVFKEMKAKGASNIELRLAQTLIQ